MLKKNIVIRYNHPSYLNHQKYFTTGMRRKQTDRRAAWQNLDDITYYSQGPFSKYLCFTC